MPLDYVNQMEKYGFVPANHHKPEFFDVSLNTIYDKHNKIIPGYKALMRDDTGDVFKVFSDDYKVIPYKETFEKFDVAIKESGLDMTDMHVATDMSHNGARVFRQYLFPAVRCDINDVTDVILRIISFNSYDGSHAMSFRSGFYSFVCANTSVVGKDIIKLHMKHVGDVVTKFEEGARLVAKAAQQFEETSRRFKVWNRMEISPALFSDMINDMPQMTDALRANLVAAYATGKEKHTMWGAYNALTAWSTHDGRGNKNWASTCATREKRVAALIEADSWKRVEQMA